MSVTPDPLLELLPKAREEIARAGEFMKRVKAGSRDSARALRDLFQLLLGLTVLEDGVRIVHTCRQGRGAPELFQVSGQDGAPLPLRDGRYLELSYVLRLDSLPDGGRRLKVVDSALRYQTDQEGDRRILRYEYLRDPKSKYAGSHLHVHGSLGESTALPADKPLEKVHFPTARVALEAVIRLLIEDFGVPAREPSEVWRPVLAWTEREFGDIAHRQISGPDR